MTLFFTEMWERFSYYGMRAILILYMTTPLAAGGLGFETGKAGAIYGNYTSSVYLTALLGGWIADRFLGARRAVFWGGVIIASGHFTMAIPSLTTFYAGLCLIAAGTGLLKPNVSTMVGSLYAEKDQRRDAGFSIFYMGINLGASIAPFVCGYLGQRVDWHYGFAAAGVGMVLGLVQYVMGRDRLKNIGGTPVGQPLTTETRVRQKLTPVEKRRVAAIVILFFFSSLFWMAFEQAGSSLNLFGERLTDTTIFGWVMPASWLQSVNALFIIGLAPVFAWLWLRLGNRQPSSPAKFAYGLFFAGLGFLVVTYASSLTGGGKVSMLWLIAVYLLHTAGELCLSPVGLSTITKLAPARMVGLMMGVWFLSISVGNQVAGRVAGFFETEAEGALVTLFGTVALITIAAALVLALLTPAIKRLTPDTE
jgi:POT family proton-dependent oligopeptide transporter